MRHFHDHADHAGDHHQRDQQCGGGLVPCEPRRDQRADEGTQHPRDQHHQLAAAAGQAFYNTSKFSLRDLKSRGNQQQLKADFEDYLDGYSIAGERLGELAVPATILTSADDPVIPVDDFHALRLPPQVELDIAAQGGHCGFIQDWSLRSFTDDYIAQRMLRHFPDSADSQSYRVDRAS